MATFTAQMDSYVRQQLELEREPWWIAGELARMANMNQSQARAFVDSRAAEVRPRIAKGYLPTLLAGAITLAVGLGFGIYWIFQGMIVMPALLVIPVGVALVTTGWFNWRRHRGASGNSK